MYNDDVDPAFVAEAEKLRAAVETLEDSFRRLGVYSNTSQLVDFGGHPAMTLQCLVGDLAFTDRVQNPTQAAADTVLRQMEHEDARTADDRLRDDLERRIAEGRPLFGDD